MISLQPAFLISVRMPLIMVKTIAATMEQIAPKRAQSTHEGMLMVAVMMNDHLPVKREAVSNDVNRKNAMTLTPLFSGDMTTEAVASGESSPAAGKNQMKFKTKSNQVQKRIK